jgi:hypothetical protein
MQFCSTSAWWKRTFRRGCVALGTMAAPCVVRRPMSGKAWHAMQRSAAAPRQGWWQAKQSVPISACAATTGPGLSISCG